MIVRGARARLRFVDLALNAAAVLFGAASLGYPLARDQGLFFYVGREWARRGTIPYRDVFEQKTPFIYALHALLVTLTGENAWAIRAAELAAIVGIGYVASRLAAPTRDPGRDGPRAPRADRGSGSASTPTAGTFGAASFAAAVFYYGYFSFGQTANCEIWEALFAGAGLLALRRPGAAAALTGGALFGLALLAKPPALAFAPLFAVELFARESTWRGRAVGVAWVVAGAAIPFALTVAYFGAHGAMGAMIDVTFRANAYYLAHDSTVSSLGDMAKSSYDAFDWLMPLGAFFAVVCTVRIGMAIRPASRAVALRYARVVALALAAYLSVAMQAKFFFYHFGVFVLPAAAFGATFYDDVLELSSRVLPRASRALPAVYVALGAAIAATMVPPDVWRTPAWMGARYALGLDPRARYDATFDSPGHGLVDISATMQVGEWLRAHSAEDDRILVRGHDAQIYAAAKRGCDCYFFWSVWLTRPERAYRRTEWLARDARDRETRPPRFVVALDAPKESLDAPEYYEARGYVRRARFGGFTILERMEP